MSIISAIEKLRIISIARWTKQEMKYDLQSLIVSLNPTATKEELFKAVIHAMILEGRRTGNIDIFIRSHTQPRHVRQAKSRTSMSVNDPMSVD